MIVVFPSDTDFSKLDSAPIQEFQECLREPLSDFSDVPQSPLRLCSSKLGQFYTKATLSTEYDLRNQPMILSSTRKRVHNSFLCYDQIESPAVSSPKKSFEGRIKRLDLRHRLPSLHPHYTNVKEIEEEISKLSPEDRNIFGSAERYFTTDFRSLIKDKKELLKLAQFIEGEIELEEMGLTRENSPQFLKLTKIFDLALLYQTRISRCRLLHKNSSHAVRTRILELCSPIMTTTDVYTMTLDEKKIQSGDLSHPREWTTERVGLYASRIVAPEFVKLLALSKQLRSKEETPRIIIIGGNTATGKSSSIKKLCQQALDSPGEVTGIVNRDHFKRILQKLTSPRQVLTSGQVHKETNGPLKLYKKAILNEHDQLSVIIDGRSTLENFEAVVRAVKQRKRKVSVIDLHAPLSTSMTRVLAMREARGEEPCVDPWSIREAYGEIIRSREILISKVKGNDLIDCYQLFYFNVLVAEKRESKFTVYSEVLLKECCRVPTTEELEHDFCQKITTQFIAAAIARGDVAMTDVERFKEKLGVWMGALLCDALQKHALGYSGIDRRY